MSGKFRARLDGAPRALRSAGARAQPRVRGEPRGARGVGTGSPGRGARASAALGTACGWAECVAAAEEEADHIEVVREQLGFSGGFLQRDLSGRSPRRRTARGLAGTRFPRAPPRPASRPTPPPGPRPAGPSKKAGGGGAAPEAGCLPAGLAAREAECWEREEGAGVRLNFSTVGSSLSGGACTSCAQVGGRLASSSASERVPPPCG